MKAVIKVAKTGDEFEFDSEQLPAVSNEYAWTYGLTQSINDACASVVRKNYDDQMAFEADARVKAGNRIEQIRSGEVPGHRAPADPEKTKARVTAFLKNLSKDELKALLSEVRAA